MAVPGGASTMTLSGTDLALARRIELGHAHSGMASAGAQQQGNPASACAIEQTDDGGWAIFQGVGLPTTQALAIGMCGTVTEAGLARIESFYWDRGSAAVIDLCTMVEPALVAMLDQRGYHVREVTNVLARTLDSHETPMKVPDGVVIRAAGAHDMNRFGTLVARGFMETETVPAEFAEMTGVLPSEAQAWFGLMNGEEMAGALLFVNERLATFAGDATLIPARGKGLQSSLIRHRIEEAGRLGCDLASASVLPGSGSYRNYERAGFQLLYARVMLYRSIPGNPGQR